MLDWYFLGLEKGRQDTPEETKDALATRSHCSLICIALFPHWFFIAVAESSLKPC